MERAANVLLPATERVGAAAADAAEWRADESDAYCHRCGASVARAAVTDSGCPHCREDRVIWHNVWRLGAYEPPLSQWILAMKFHRSWGWAEWFGEQLGARMSRHVASQRDLSAVVPVPLHLTRRLTRGYDQSAEIARCAAAAAGLAFAPLLRRTRRTAAQMSLTSSTQRRANVKNAFAIAHVDLTGWTIWLIDDVKTTGATAEQCARLLLQSGASAVNLAVVAVADPKCAQFTAS